MRPAGEIRMALLQAARDLVAEAVQPCKGPTLSELASKAGVGRDAARVHVSNCKRSGALEIVGHRRVAYRNRPVAEYAPKVVLSLEDVQEMTGATVLSSCMAGWTR